jgi:hypothetical protein
MTGALVEFTRERRIIKEVMTPPYVDEVHIKKAV